MSYAQHLDHLKMPSPSPLKKSRMTQRPSHLMILDKRVARSEMPPSPLTPPGSRRKGVTIGTERPTLLEYTLEVALNRAGFGISPPSSLHLPPVALAALERPPVIAGVRQASKLAKMLEVGVKAHALPPLSRPAATRPADCAGPPRLRRLATF